MAEIGDDSSWANSQSQLSETACVRTINDGTPLQDEIIPQDELFSQLSQDTLEKVSNAAAAIAMEQVRIFC